MRDLKEALTELYGFADFRGPQREIIEHHLAGDSALVLMATGDGKSLCYQLPAFVGEGLTIVVSPLIALMDDQVAALEARGLPATCIHSMLDKRERQARLDAVLRHPSTGPPTAWARHAARSKPTNTKAAPNKTGPATSPARKAAAPSSAAPPATQSRTVSEGSTRSAK